MADTIGIKIGIDGEKEFKAAIAALNGQMKTFSSEMYASVTSMAGMADKETLVANKSDILAKQIETTQQKIELLGGEYERQKSYLNDLGTALEQAKAKYGENSDEAVKAENAYNRQTTAVERLSAQLNTAKGDLNTYTNEMKNVSDSMDNTGKQGISLGDIIKSNLTSEAIIAGIKALADAVKKVAEGMVDAVTSTAKYGDTVDKQSQKIGMSAKAYQEWDFVMQHCGTSISTMTQGMKTLSNAATDGNGAFEKLGISLEEARSLSQEDLFAKTIAALQNMESSSERTALANDLLGRGAIEMGALLNMSAEDTAEMRKQLSELGGVMSDEAVKQSAEFQDQLLNVNTALEGIKRTIAGQVIPYFSSLMEGFSNWVAGFQELVPQIQEQGLAPLFGALSTSITTYMPQFVQKGTEMIAGFIEQIGLYLPNILTLGYQVVGSLISGVAASLPQVAGSALDTVTNFLNAMTEQYPVIMEEGVKVLEAVINGIIDTIPELVSRLPEVITAFVNFISSALPQIVETGVRLLGELTAGIIKAIPTLVSNLPKIISAIVGGLGSLLGGIVNAGKDIVKGLWKGINDAKDWLINKIKGWGNSLLNTIKDVFGINSPSRVMRDQVGKNIVLGVAKGIQASTDTAVTAAKKASSAISSAMASSIKGGAMAMSYDVAANIKSPTDMVTKGSLYKATEAAVNGMSINASTAGGDNGDMISININLDGRTVASVLFDPLKREVMQRGEGLA